MKVVETEITPFINNSVYLELREDSYISSLDHARPSYHQHPELQLTLILEGHGKRIIGSEVADFQSGDMVLIGSNVPHVWLSDPVYFERESKLRARVITVYIHPAIFQSMFDLITAEMDSIRVMIRQASLGINIFGETRKTIARMLVQLSAKTGFEKMLGLLQVMNMISVSSEKQLIMESQLKETETGYPDRMMAVLRFMKENLHRQISLDEVSEIACMTKPSFCRYFKSRIRKTFFQYLEEIRVNHSCRMMIESDIPIAEVAYLCGYNSDSYFCKIFKMHLGKSPYQFRADLRKHHS